ncbi:MFS transporter [Roseomonas haemaphysalidis]|uniref:MFS transporter n=1 Tax=Roseomonas haemaphysalidis TaxID=2768162 RepID=A0ABS3KR20_9PROT|nr:MFS transporter [Roseomonas haemaphysalidis]MBO1079901.1 MFS transporter [Roseomonas haemaphysalidis]
MTPNTPAPATIRRMVAVFGLCGFSGALASRALDPLMGELAQGFGAPHHQVALLATAFALPYALVQPVLGPVGDALGKRRIVTICAGLLALMLLGCALAPGLGWLFAARVASGLAAGGIFPLTLALFGDAVPLAQRQVAISRVLACAILGQLAGGAVSGLVAPFVGWRGVLGVCAAAAALSFAVLVAEARGKPAPPPGPRPLPGEVVRRYAAILSLPAARPLYLGVFGEGIAVFGVFPFLAVLLGRPGGSGAAEAGLAVAAFGLGGFGYTMAAPLLLRHLGQGRMMQLAGVLAALGLAVIAAAGGWLAAGAAGALLLGLGFFMLHNSIQVRVTEVAPQARGSAVALHAFCFFMGQSLGPAVYGSGLALAGRGGMLAAGAVGIALIGAWLGGMRQPARA